MNFKKILRKIGIVSCIELIFLILSFILLYFTGKKIGDNVLKIYNLVPDLSNLEEQLADSVANTDFSNLGVSLESMNTAYVQIITYFTLAVLGFFVLWVMFKGLEWRTIYEGKKGKLGDFIKRFIVISILLFSFNTLLFYLLSDALIQTALFLDINMMMFYFVFFSLIYIALFHFSGFVSLKVNSIEFKKACKEYLKIVKNWKLWLIIVGFFVLVYVLLFFEFYFEIESLWRYWTVLIFVIINASYKVVYSEKVLK